MIEKIAVISLWAENVMECVHFYKDVLGLELLPGHHAGQPHFDVGGVYLTILKGKPRPAEETVPARFPLIAFRVDNLERAAAVLEAHGIDLPWGVEKREGASWVMFHDPAGNLIELT
jgi:catechol 2,3-dioxygenase-like lactoylglutathione lyase family enzyme